MKVRTTLTDCNGTWYLDLRLSHPSRLKHKGLQIAALPDLPPRPSSAPPTRLEPRPYTAHLRPRCRLSYAFPAWLPETMSTHKDVSNSLGQAQYHPYRERDRPYKRLQRHLSVNTIKRTPLPDRPRRVAATHVHPDDRVKRHARINLSHVVMLMASHAADTCAFSDRVVA